MPRQRVNVSWSLPVFAKLVLLFTIIPIIELTLLITVGNYVGLPVTIGIVVTTALVGATLGKYQGLSAWRKIKGELATGQLPQEALMDGLAVLIASAFLITPGVLTDLAAFTLLFPITRAPIKRLLRRRIDAWLDREQVGVFGGFGGNMFAGLGEEYEDHAQTRSDDIVIEPMANPRKEGEKKQDTPVMEVLEITSGK